MSKRFKKFLKSAKKAAPVALPILLGALGNKMPKVKNTGTGIEDEYWVKTLAELDALEKQYDTIKNASNISSSLPQLAPPTSPRMINTSMRNLANLRLRKTPHIRVLPEDDKIIESIDFMKEGGMVEAAQDIADKGRNGDSMLVHMAPEEVQGIAALGGVSINPETGLPEMFKFKDFMKVAIPIAITAMAGPAAGAAGSSKALGGTMLGNALKSSVGKSLATGLAQYASQRLMGTDSDTALDAGIAAGATYGAGMAASKFMQPSQQQIAKTDAIRKSNIATQQAYLDALAPDQFITKTTPNYSDVGPVVPQQTVPRFSTENVPLIKEQFPTLSEGLRSGMTQAELDAQRGIAQADLDALQAPTDKFRIPGIETRTISDVGPTRPGPLYVPKSDVYSGIGAGAIGALSAVPEEEEEERKRKQIDMAKPYSDPVTYPGAGYGSREYGYFGPNYGLYAKEGGHIKQMQEGGDVDTPASAFQGDLMAFAPGIVGGANYGMGAMPGGIDSSEFNYNVAPNMGGYDYRSFVPAGMQGQGIASVGTGMGSGEQVTGDPNIVQRGMAEDAAKKAREEAAKKAKASSKPKPIGYTLRKNFNPYNPYQSTYTKVPVYGYEEGGITSLPQTEGQVEGNGDGMSDEVYGDIENQQEVALSKDEFIVPADVVSSLGNGSSDAGADELYRMMERVRVAKTGKKTQPPEIDAEDYLPA